MKRKLLLLCIVLLHVGYVPPAYCYNYTSVSDSATGGSRHYFAPLVEIAAINSSVWAFDRYVLKQDYANISAQSIRNNLQRGFMWDNDKLSTNMFFHPYNGGLFYSAARSANLGYGTSVLYTLCGSLMWEIALENEPPSINDLMATTIGGAAVGEVMMRLSDWLITNRHQSTVANISAFLLSPTSWVNRHLYPKQIITPPLSINIKANNTTAFTPAGNQYLFSLSADARYGNFFVTANTKPFDAFQSTLTVALYSKPIIKEFLTVGSLYSKEVNEYEHGNMVLGVYQHFDYFDSRAIGDEVPYMLAAPTAASVGICMSRETENITTTASIYMKAIALGAVQSDHYNNIDRSYNMGQGVGSQIILSANYRNKATADIALYQYVMYTFHGFDGEEQDMRLHNLYLDAPGNISTANMLIIKAEVKYFLSKNIFLSANANYFFRHTQYKYFPIITKNIFEVSLGIGAAF